MNVWTRDLRPATLTPVIVWLHTGAFIGASANFAGSNGRTFAEQTGAVVVAPNYRVGPLGFLAHRALAAEDPTRPTSGNYGLLDQQAALRWVQDNIARFGGDPNNVALAGTSAGGATSACISSRRGVPVSITGRSCRARTFPPRVGPLMNSSSGQATPGRRPSAARVHLRCWPACAPRPAIRC